MIARRSFLFGACAASVSRAVNAQARMLRVGYVTSETLGAASTYLDALRQGLREQGYEEGRNVVIDARAGEGSTERVEEVARELAIVADVIVCQSGRVIGPVSKVATNVPLVISASADPVAAGWVDSYAKPGRNITGITLMALQLVGKRMELLKETMPNLRKVAIVANPEHPGQQGELRASQEAARSLGLSIDYFVARNAAELERAFGGVVEGRSDAILAFADGVLIGFSDRFADFSVKQRIPTVSSWAQFAERGNALAYGPNLAASYRRLAYFVDRIAKGASPASIPIETPTTVDLVVNAKTARAIGLDIPSSVLVRANRVIE